MHTYDEKLTGNRFYSLFPHQQARWADELPRTNVISRVAVIFLQKHVLSQGSGGGFSTEVIPEWEGDGDLGRSVERTLQLLNALPAYLCIVPNYFVLTIKD